MFLLFFQILGSFVLILFFWQLSEFLTLHYTYCIAFIIHAEYFWSVMADSKEKFCTLILKFMYIIFCLLTEPQTVKGGPRTAATSKMELFEIIVNGFQPLTIITKCSILDVAAALDPPLTMLQLKILILL